MAAQRSLEVDIDSGFAFLDVSRLYVAWATYRGVLITPPQQPERNGWFVSWWWTDLVRYQSKLARELQLERVRAQHFPNRISRLVGMFCFLDRDCAERAKDWGWHFCEENLVELDLREASGRDRLDANWIGNAELLDPDEWMPRYWQGIPYPDAEPMWETLVTGRVAVLGTELRDRAYEVVKSNWPDSLMLLEISRLGAWIDSDIGSICAFMVEEPKSYRFTFLMDMRDADNEDFLERLRRLIASGHPVNRADIQPHYEQGSFGRKPDMTQFEFSVPKMDIESSDT